MGLRFKKSIVIVDREFQFRYGLVAIFVGLLSTLLTGFVIFFPLFHFELLRFTSFLPWPVIAGMVGAAAFNILLLGFMGLLIAHKLAGPVYSLVRVCRQIGSGKWVGKMRLRKGDELRFLVRNFNHMLEDLRVLAAEDLMEVRRLRAAIGPNQDSKEVVEILDNIEKRFLKRLGR